MSECFDQKYSTSQFLRTPRALEATSRQFSSALLGWRRGAKHGVCVCVSPADSHNKQHFQVITTNLPSHWKQMCCWLLRHPITMQFSIMWIFHAVYTVHLGLLLALVLCLQSEGKSANPCGPGLLGTKLRATNEPVCTSRSESGETKATEQAA